MLSEIVALRNKRQPTGGTNTDVIQYDYKFWTELEKLAKTNRDTSKEKLKSVCEDPEKPGVILRGNIYVTELKATKPVMGFNFEEFLNLLYTEFPDLKGSRAIIRELSVKAVIPGNPRLTYTTKEIGMD